MRELIAPLIRRLNQVEEQIKRLTTRQGDFSRRATEVTLASDAFTADHHDHFMLQPQTGTSDTLATINGGSDGRRIVIYPKDVGDTISVVSSGNIAATRTLSSPTSVLELVYSATQSKWLETAAATAGGDVTTHAAKHWIEAHPSPPATNRGRIYYSYNYSVVGGSGVDESNNLLTMFNTIGQTLAGGKLIIASANGTDPIRLDKLVSVYWPDMDIEFRSDVLLGALGGIRIMGEMDEFVRTATNAGKLRSTAAEGSKTLELTVGGTSMQASHFVVGDQIVLRGENDITGKALYKQTVNVTAIDTINNNLTIAQELEYTFEPTYPSSEWPPDLTTGTTIYVVRICGLTVDANRGDMTFTITNPSNAVVGGTYRISDGRNENQLNASAIRGSLLPYENDANMEFVKITAINGSVITIDRPLSRSYLSSSPYFGAFARVLPVKNSRITGLRASYNADQSSKNAHAMAMGFAEDCEFADCSIDGILAFTSVASGVVTSTGRRGQAVRLADSYNCWGRRIVVRGAGHTGSGEGYGLTHYKATGGGFEGCQVWGCRHSFLVQASALFVIADCQSWDDRISGFDLHGANEIDGVVENCTGTRSDLHTSDASQGAIFRAGNTSHTVGCHNVDWINCRAYNVVETDIAGFDFLPNSSNLSFSNCKVFGGYYGIKSTKNSKQCQPVQDAENIIIQGCHFYDITGKAIYIEGAPTYDGINSIGKVKGIILKGNVLYNSVEHIVIDGNSGVSEVTISENEIIEPITSPANNFYGIDISDVSELTVRANNLHKCSRGLSLTNATEAVIVLNLFSDTVDVIPFTDGGGNTGPGGGDLIYVANIVDNDTIVGGGGIIFTRANGTLSADTDTTAVIAHNNSSPTITDGLQAVSVSYTPGAAGRRIRVIGHISYISMTGATGPVQANLWAGSTAIDMITERITIGGSNPNGSGGPFILTGDFVSASTSAITIQMRIGPDVNTNTVRLVSKFNGLDQPYLQIEEYIEPGSGAGVGFLDAEGNPADVAVAAADGTSAYAARRDHVHTIAPSTVTPAMTNGGLAVLAGQAGGQNLRGGTASGDDLTLESTSHATKGDVFLQPNGGNVMIGTGTSTRKLHILHAGTSGADDVLIESGAPDLAFKETDAAADNKVWDILVNAAQIAFRIVNDALSTATEWLTVTRSGTTVSAVNFPNGSVHVGGSGGTAAKLTIDGPARFRQSGSTRYRFDFNPTSGTIEANAFDDTGGVYIPLKFGGLPVSFHASGDATNALYLAANGNLGLRTSSEFGSGQGVFGVLNRSVAPSTNPTGGFVMYGESGAAKVRGSSGTVTTFANAEPHCPVCGADYMKEFDSKKYGYFAICLVCLANELGERDWIIRGESRLES